MPSYSSAYKFPKSIEFNSILLGNRILRVDTVWYDENPDNYQIISSNKPIIKSEKIGNHV